MSSPLRSSRRHILTASIAALLAASTAAQAQTWFWDAGPDGDGAIGGSGPWDLSSPNWDPTGADAGAPDNVVWPNTATAIAVFGGAPGAVIISTGTGVTANGLTFNSSGYEISSAAGADVLTLAGTTPTITVTNVGHFARINSVIAGSAGVTTAGAGALFLTNANTFTGGLTISSGSYVGISNPNAVGAAGELVRVLAGGTLNIGGQAINGNPAPGSPGREIRIAGAGVGGVGALISTSGAPINTLAKVTLTADATISSGGNAPTSAALGGNIITSRGGRIDIRTNAAPSVGQAHLDLANFTLTKQGGHFLALVNADVSAGNIVVNEGILAIEANTIINGPADGSQGRITVNPGGVLSFWGVANNGVNVTRPIVVNGGIVGDAQVSSAAQTIPAPITITGAQNPTFTATSAGLLTLSGLISKEAGSTATAFDKRGGTVLALSNPGNSFDLPVTIHQGTLRANFTTDLPAGGVPPAEPLTTTDTPLGTASTVFLSGGTLSLRINMANDATLQRWNLDRAIVVNHAPSVMDFDRLSNTAQTNKHVIVNSITMAAPTAANGWSIGQNQLTFNQLNTNRLEVPLLTMNSDTVLTNGDFTMSGNVVSANRNSLAHSGGSTIQFIAPGDRDFNAFFHLGGSLRVGSGFGTPTTDITATAGEGQIYVAPGATVTFRNPGNIAAGNLIELTSQRMSVATVNLEQFDSIPAEVRARGGGNLGLGNTTAFGDIDLSRIGDGTFRIGAGFAGSGAGVIVGQISPGAGNIVRMGAGNTVTVSGADRITGTAALEVGSPLINGGFTSTGNGTVLLTDNNSYTGGTIVNRSSTLRFQTPGAVGSGPITIFGVAQAESAGAAGPHGTFIGAPPVTIGGGSTIRFSNDAINNAATDTPDRWGDATPINLVASGIEMRSRNIGASLTNETVGAVSFTGGSTINLQRLQAVTDHISQLTLGSLTRVNQGTIELLRNTGTGAGYGGGQRLIISDGAPTPSNGMVAPWIVAQNNGPIEFMTYGANGFTPLAAGGYDATVTTGAYAPGELDYNPGTNTGGKVNVTTAPLTLADNPTLYALRTDQSINLSGANNTITLHSNADGAGAGGDSGGGIISNHSTGTITIQPNLVFNNGAASREGIIFTRSGGTLAVTGTITANGLTKFGAGTLNLHASSPSLSGTIAVNQGILQAFGPTATGVHNVFGTGGVLLAGGQLNLRSHNSAVTGTINPTLQHGLTVAENVPLAVIDVNRSGADTASTGTFIFNPADPGSPGLQLLGSATAQGQTLTVSGGNYNVQFASNVLNSFTGNITINTTGTRTLTLNNSPSILGNNPVITKSGDGTFIVGAFSTPAGTVATPGTSVVIDNGVLEVRSVIALGTGDTTSFTLNRGTLFFRRDAAGNYGSLGSGTRYPVTVNGNSTIQFDRVGGTATGFPIRMGNLTVRNDATLNFNHGNGVVLEVGPTHIEGTAFFAGNLSVTSQDSGAKLMGQVTGGALVKTGASFLHLQSSNTYDGGTYVQSGMLRARSGNSLGLGPVYLNPGATLDFDSNSNLQFGQPLIVRSNTAFQPMISVNNNFTVHPTDDVDTSAAPTGIVALSNGTTGTYDSDIDLSALYGGRWSLGGVPQAAYDPVFTGARVTAGAGNLYRLGGGGTSFAMGTDFARTAQANVLTGPNNVRLGFDSGNILSANTTNWQYSIAGVNDFSGGSTIVHRGMVARLFSNNDGARSGLSNSAVDVFGVLSLSGMASLDNGASNVNAVTLHPGSALFFDNNTAAANNVGDFVPGNVENRWNDTTPISLNSGMINLIGANNATSSETVGNVTYSGGARLRAQLTGTGTATLALNELARAAGKGHSLLLQTSGAATLGAADKIVVLNNPPAVTNGMVDPSIVNASANSFVSYDPALGFVNVTYDNTVTTPIPVGLDALAKVDVNHTAAVVLGDNPTIYALRTNRDINLAGPFDRITLRSGGLIAHANALTINPDLVFHSGAAPIEAKIYNSVTTNINGSLIADGITKSGNAVLVINVPQSNYASGWTVNSGALQINHPGGLGQSVPGNGVTLNGALSTGGHASQAFAQTTLNFNHNSGTPELVTFTGGPITVINEGTIRIGALVNDRNMQIPEVIVDSSSTLSSAALTVDVPFSRVRGIIPKLTLLDDLTLRVYDAGATTDTGRVVAAVVENLTGANKNLLKVGNRTLELGGDNSATFTGGSITVSQGTVRVLNDGSLGSPTTAVTIERNATLEIAKSSFNPASPARITQLPGSIERWNAEDARGAAGSTYNLPEGVNLQLNTNLLGVRTIGLRGGSLEGFLWIDHPVAAVERTVGSGVTVNLLADSFVGQNILQGQGYDAGRAPTVAQPFGDNVTGAFLRIDGNITGAFNLTKTGLDTVTLAGSENTYNDTFVEMGTLRIDRNNVLPVGRTLITRLGGVFDLFGFDQTVGGLGTADAGFSTGGTSLGSSGRITNSAVTDNVLRVNSADDYTYNGILEGNVSLAKDGAGKLTLTAANTHAGPTTVLAGELEITGSIEGTREIEVRSGAFLNTTGLLNGFTLLEHQTLKGRGSVFGNLFVDGLVKPGDTIPGQLSLSDSAHFNSGSSLSIELASDTVFGQLAANGVTLDGEVQLQLSLAPGYNPALNTSFRIVDNISGIPITGTSGLFTWDGPEGTLTEGETFFLGGQAFQISYTGGDGNDILLVAIPEPSGLSMLFAGAGVMAGLRRFRRRSA